MGDRSRNYCGTWFPVPSVPDGTGHKYFVSQFSRVSQAAFCVAQLESSPTTGRVHVQFYIHLKQAMTMSALQRALSPLVPHLEACRGSIEQNVDYCTKDATRVNGTKPKWFCCVPEMEYYIGLFDFSLFTSDRLIPLSVNGSSRHLVPDGDLNLNG